MKVDVEAFLVRVSFPARDPGSCNVARAYLHLQDDADDHKFRVAVPREFALAAAERLRETFDDDESRADQDHLQPGMGAMTAARKVGPQPHRPQTRARAKALVLDELRLQLLHEAALLRRALDGARTLLVAGAEPDAETTGRMLAHCSAFVDDVAAFLGGRRS